jgi:transcriptional regulator
MVKKGRSAVQDGTMNHNGHKLTDEQIKEILYKVKQKGITQHAISIEYGVSDALISGIVNGYRWKHITQKGNE